MKIVYSDFISKLDNAQHDAAIIEENAVIAAGAGSGKTKVLSSRYIHLIVEKGYKTDEILTLTFTQKAATEMRSRIYSDLGIIDHPNAGQAVRDFHKAQISTIDSFCAGIAKHGCRLFGVSPEFTSDDEGSLQLARNLALPFILEHRNRPSVRNFLKKKSITYVANFFLAETAHYNAAISKPIDVITGAKKQGLHTVEAWDELADETETLMRFLAAIDESKTATQQNMKKSAAKLTSLARLFFDETNGKFGSFSGITKSDAEKINDLLQNFKTASKAYASLSICKQDSSLKEQIKAFRDNTIVMMQSLLLYVCTRSVTEDALLLLDEFQQLYLDAKRSAGILTFRDIALLAVDALKLDPTLRQSYKTKLKAIMIDEFQDDNDLQRDLLFLLAEKESLNDVLPLDFSPDKSRLCDSKLFFVGDEKQSIYQFRGADVSVFRRLAVDLGNTNMGYKMPELTINYRTQKSLIDSFNALFPDVFLPPQNLPDYEASFTPITPFRDTKGVTAEIEMFIINKFYTGKEFPGTLKSEEMEALVVAQRIWEMVDSKQTIYDRDAECIRAIKWDDIAILFRTKTNQHLIERYLRYYNIPYATENQRGLFSDAPVNDMYCIMRLAVYPRDRLAYAALLRSPFAKLSDNAVAAVLAVSDTVSQQPVAPFCAEAASVLSGKELDRFTRAGELYRAVTAMIDRKPISEIVTMLWYDSGYRYEIVSKPSLRIYADLYDFYFELARLADLRHTSMAQFLDTIAGMMTDQTAVTDISIPIERQTGVTLMTVHKSKGLEFPVVFIVYCGSGSNVELNNGIVYITKDFGITANISKTEDIDIDNNTNFFFIRGENENSKKAEAELRRLLYVAMTRAENTLVMIGSQNLDEIPDTGERNQSNQELFKNAENSREHPENFFDMFFYACSRHRNCIKAQEIMPILRRNIPTAPAAQTIIYPLDSATALYTKTPDTVYTQKDSDIIGASQLHLIDVPANRYNVGEQDSETDDQIDTLLKGTGLNAAHFGTIVHAAIEAHIHNEPFEIPRSIHAKIDETTAKKLTEAAEVFAKCFFSSQLASLLTKASLIRTEFPLKTQYVYNGENLIVSGQIDLLFCMPDNTVYVVDFKTDRIEKPDIHHPQLAAYKKAAGDLFPGQPIKGMLFYLRTGNTVEV